MTISKAVNYDANTLQTMRDTYTGKDNKAEIAALAELTGKSAGSLVAKLAQMKLYVKATATGSIAKPKYTKNARAVKIVSLVEGLKATDVDSLEKASVNVLDILEKALTTS